MCRVLVQLVAMDKHTYVVHIHCTPDKEAVLKHMVEAIHTPDTMDNPGEVENQAFAQYNLLQGHRRALVDSSPLEADMQDSADMVDKQAGSEALLRDTKPETLIHARDRQFVDQQVALILQDWLDEEAFRLEYRTLLVF